MGNMMNINDRELLRMLECFAFSSFARHSLEILHVGSFLQHSRVMETLNDCCVLSALVVFDEHLRNVSFSITDRHTVSLATFRNGTNLSATGFPSWEKDQQNNKSSEQPYCAMCSGVSMITCTPGSHKV